MLDSPSRLDPWHRVFHLRPWHGAGVVGFDPGCAGNVVSAHSGERIKEPVSCDPLNGARNTIPWVFRTYIVQLVTSKRSHLIRSCQAWQGPSEAAEIRSSVATCETLLARRQHSLFFVITINRSPTEFAPDLEQNCNSAPSCQ